MKRYGLRYLYNNLGSVIKKGESFYITNHDKVVALVIIEGMEKNVSKK